MKASQSIFLIGLLTALSSTASAQTYGWVDWSAHKPEQVSFSDVHFIGNEGWITGGLNKLYHSTCRSSREWRIFSTGFKGIT